jgi:hypothetical protein
MAVTARGGDAAGVVAHSDRGSQYTSLVYGAYAKQSGIDLSMGSIGDPWDNALAESFFASLEKELLRRERFQTRAQARLRIFWYRRMLLQPTPQALQPRHALTDRLRTATPTGGPRGLTTRCQRKRVISTRLHGACRDRTGDLRLAKPTLSQLS